ncbi:MAG: Wzz/FepE/Etk N-terminal domain-containing protein [Spirosomataceae bacterium]
MAATMQNIHWNKTQDRYTEIAPEIDIKRIFRVLWSRWYWIVGAMALALLLWFAFLKIAKPRYIAEVSLKYNVKQTELGELSELIKSDDGTNKEYATEKYVIQSEEVINGAIKKLNYPFTFYRETTFRQEDVYPFQPFTAQLISFDNRQFGAGIFEIQKEGIITYKTEDKTENRRFDLMKDTLISVKGLAFKINSVERLAENYTFLYNDLNNIRQALDDQIGVDEEERNLPIVNVSFTYFNQQFTQDFLEN